MTVDLLPQGYALGGTAAYAPKTAARLGLRAGVVTTADETLDLPGLLPDVEIVRIPSRASSTFRNQYQDTHRIQQLLAMAETVSFESVPLEWRNSPIVHLAPVVHEIGSIPPELFGGSLVALTPQGLLRHWDPSGLVKAGAWCGDDSLLDRSGVVIFSEEDVAGDPSFLSRCLGRVPITLLTQGERGATLYSQGEVFQFPAFRVDAVDPTGAGDVFAAAFLVEYYLTRDPHLSTAFACCAASLVVESQGLEGVPDRMAVEERLKQYPRT